MDFANVLFGGPCNRRCYYCIGESLPERVNVNNLNIFPPRGIDPFVDEVNKRGIREIVFTGTTTDPQMYRHEVRLLDLLRSRIPASRYCVHTNGARALQKIELFNQYDRACISFPSFDVDIYERHMGSRAGPGSRAHPLARADPGEGVLRPRRAQRAAPPGVPRSVSGDRRASRRPS